MGSLTQGLYCPSKKLKSNIVKYTLLVVHMKHNIINLKIAALICLLFCSIDTSIAQIRPADNGEIKTLPAKSLQSDTYYGRQDGATESINNVNTTLRYGLATNYELQLTWASQRLNSPIRNVTADATILALKAYLNKESQWMPTLAVSIGSTLTIHPEETPFSPFLNLVYEKSINNIWRVNGNALISVNEQDGKSQTGYSANIEADVTPWLTTYIGIVGNTHAVSGNDGEYQRYLEIGSLIWISNRFTLFPFYDFDLGDDPHGDIFNVGLLYRLH